MPIEVEVPEVGTLVFPDGMSQDAMRDAIYKNFPQTAPHVPASEMDASGLIPSTTPFAPEQELGAKEGLGKIPRNEGELDATLVAGEQD